MPPYAWLYRNELSTKLTVAKLRALSIVGVPYTDAEISGAVEALKAQADKVAADLKSQGVQESGIESKEIVALIAYLQRLGTDIKAKG